MKTDLYELACHALDATRFADNIYGRTENAVEIVTKVVQALRAVHQGSPRPNICHRVADAIAADWGIK